MSDKTYTINEIFCSVQGEGVRAGTLNHFVRFTGCNLTCKEETHGFDCDTEFMSGRKMTADAILAELAVLNRDCTNVIFTGGEPLLQLDSALTDLLVSHGYYLAVETNGSLPVPQGVALNWITCSPKVAEHAVRLQVASELKYVRRYGQGIPRPSLKEADYLLISPAFNGMTIDQRALDWCIQLIHENPQWRLSLQTHKFIHVR
jgi:7-carboxy-7-deazaguanine synthase